MLRFFYILTNVYKMMFYVILFGKWESMKQDYTAVSLIKLNEKNSSTMVSYSYRQTSLLYSFLRYYDNIITTRAFLTQFQWPEANVLDNWQLAELPQSGGREFNPHRVHNNLSVPLWVYMRFPVPEHENQTKQIYIEPKLIHRPCLLYFTKFSWTGS